MGAMRFPEIEKPQRALEVERAEGALTQCGTGEYPSVIGEEGRIPKRRQEQAVVISSRRASPHPDHGTM